MTYPPYPHPHYHGRKFYILVATVVVGAILILLVVNDNGGLGSSIGLTGSAVGITGGGMVDKAKNSDSSKATVENTNRNIGLNLSYTTVPKIKETNFQFSSLKLKFNDPQTKIGINEEVLELKGLKSAEMEIGGFKGEIDFDGTSITLKGEAQRAKVNGIAISTKKAMQISFSGLVYDSLKLTGANLGSLDFREGTGSIKVKDKLGYALEYGDQLKLTSFKGDFDIDSQNTVDLKGIVGGVSVKGEFSLNLG